MYQDQPGISGFLEDLAETFDLYTKDDQYVFAVESGTIVGIEDFTGINQQTPWWEDTHAIMIYHPEIVQLPSVVDTKLMYSEEKITNGVKPINKKNEM